MDAIRAHRVVIVSKSYCPYSRAVKKLFNEQYPEVYPHVIEIDQARGLNMASFQSMLMETYGHRTVPQVFVGAKRVGGSDETFRAHVDGTLARLLDDASGFDNSPSSYDAGASEEAPERRQAAQVTAETASVTDPTSDDDDDELAKIQAEIAAWEAEGKTEREEGADGWGGQMEAVPMDAEEETQF
jgi:glutaredoxin